MSPTVAGEILYIGSCSGVYYAFDRTTGEVLWSYDTAADGPPASFHGDPLVVGDLVITGSDHTLGGNAYAFDRLTGAVRWTMDVGGLETDLIQSGSLVIGGASDGSLVALDIATGEQAWSFSNDSLRSDRGFALAPALDGDRLYYGGRDGIVYALSASSGEEIWRQEVGGEVSTPTRMVGSDLYVGTYENEILRLDSRTGAITARMSTEFWPHHGLVAAGECLVVLLGQLQVGCIDRALEGVRWTRSTKDEWSAYNPMVLDDVVIVGSASGELVALRPNDGSTAWSRELEGVLRGLGTAEGVLYVGTLSGSVYALELPEQVAPGDARQAHGEFTGEIKPVLYVQDVEASLPFYRDVLGFEFDGYAETAEGPYYAELIAGGRKVGLHEPTSSDQEGRVGQQRLYLRVRDLASQRRRVEAWDMEPGRLMETDWMDMFTVVDPDGNEIVFAVTDPARHPIDPW